MCYCQALVVQDQDMRLCRIRTGGCVLGPVRAVGAGEVLARLLMAVVAVWSLQDAVCLQPRWRCAAVALVA
jgi:hypothetical protein